MLSRPKFASIFPRLLELIWAGARFFIEQKTKGKHQFDEDDSYDFETEFYGYEGDEFSWEELEVIGNVHQHPELLGAE